MKKCKVSINSLLRFRISYLNLFIIRLPPYGNCILTFVLNHSFSIAFITTTKVKISQPHAEKSFLLLNNQDHFLFIWHEHIQTYQVANPSKIGKIDKDLFCLHFRNWKHAGCTKYKVLTGSISYARRSDYIAFDYSIYIYIGIHLQDG